MSWFLIDEEAQQERDILFLHISFEASRVSPFQAMHTVTQQYAKTIHISFDTSCLSST